MRHVHGGPRLLKGDPRPAAARIESHGGLARRIFLALCPTSRPPNRMRHLRPSMIAIAIGSFACFSTFVALAQPITPPSTVRTTSLPEAVAIALRQSPDILTRQAELDDAEGQRAEVRGQFGPKLRVDANLQQWNSPFDLPFGPEVFRVREAFTWTVSPTIIQPITQLLTIFDQYKMQDFGVDIAGIRREVARRDVAFQVVQGYYRLLEAQRLSEVADASVAQLEAQRRVAQSQFDNGVIA